MPGRIKLWGQEFGGFDDYAFPGAESLVTLFVGVYQHFLVQYACF